MLPGWGVVSASDVLVVVVFPTVGAAVVVPGVVGGRHIEPFTWPAHTSE